jgi:hypothetical protein
VGGRAGLAIVGAARGLVRVLTRTLVPPQRGRRPSACALERLVKTTLYTGRPGWEWRLCEGAPPASGPQCWPQVATGRAAALGAQLILSFRPAGGTRHSAPRRNHSFRHTHSVNYRAHCRSHPHAAVAAGGCCLGLLGTSPANESQRTLKRPLQSSECAVCKCGAICVRCTHSPAHCYSAHPRCLLL